MAKKEESDAQRATNGRRKILAKRVVVGTPKKKRVVLESYEKGTLTLQEAVEAAKTVKLARKTTNANKIVSYRSAPQLY